MKNKKNLVAFTIVELLVVIVVIGIIAAITIVSYSNITNRSATSSEISAANNLVSKAEVYKSATGDYPSSTSALTSLPTNDPSYIPSSSFTSYAFAGSGNTTQITSAQIISQSKPTGSANNYIRYVVCGYGSAQPAAAPSNMAGITTKTGVIAQYWDYTVSSNNVKNDINQGIVNFTGGSGPGAAGTVTVGVLTYNASCVAEL